ncbi:MAG TPA: HupE/UreJ family protein [Burkholderiales bacterium]|nr:HupE/UreJ family protein [Burkholderiales bacterium]
MSAGRRVAWALALLFLGAGATARAHIPSGYDLRAVHFVRKPDGLHGYYRLTLPLVVANRLGAKRPDGNYDPAPFTELRIESRHGFYYPDAPRIRAEPLVLGQLIAEGHRLEVDATVREAQVLSVRAYPKGSVPPFNTLKQAQTATAPGPGYPTDAPEVDAAYVVVDAHLLYPMAGNATVFRLSSTLDNRVLGQPDVQNLFVDHMDQRSVVYRASGLLREPITLNPSAWNAAVTFTLAGIAHIASGADHLLFVLCLALGAPTLVALAWRVTGFTLGHCVTLVIGFVGYVPQAAWFVPAVETAVAGSVALAAAAVLRTTRRAPLVALTAGVGLVHGLGFSFALREMLQLDGPHVVVSLAAFNLGVEVGQIGFATAVWVILNWMANHAARWRDPVRVSIACCCIAIAALWIIDRGKSIFIATT